MLIDLTPQQIEYIAGMLNEINDWDEFQEELAGVLVESLHDHYFEYLAQRYGKNNKFKEKTCS